MASNRGLVAVRLLDRIMHVLTLLVCFGFLIGLTCCHAGEGARGDIAAGNASASQQPCMPYPSATSARGSAQRAATVHYGYYTSCQNQAASTTVPGHAWRTQLVPSGSSGRWRACASRFKSTKGATFTAEPPSSTATATSCSPGHSARPRQECTRRTHSRAAHSGTHGWACCCATCYYVDAPFNSPDAAPAGVFPTFPTHLTTTGFTIFNFCQSTKTKQQGA